MKPRENEGTEREAQGVNRDMKVIFRRAEVSILAEVCFPRRPHEGQPRSLHVMSVKVDLTFVDENDFQKRGKWYFWSDNSSWGTSSTISMDTNDSLADISSIVRQFDSLFTIKT